MKTHISTKKAVFLAGICLSILLLAASAMANTYPYWYDADFPTEVWVKINLTANTPINLTITDSGGYSKDFDAIFLCGDDFDRANNATVGNGWTEDVAANWAIVDNRLEHDYNSGASNTLLYTTCGYTQQDFIYESRINNTDTSTTGQRIYSGITAAANERITISMLPDLTKTQYLDSAGWHDLTHPISANQIIDTILKWDESSTHYDLVQTESDSQINVNPHASLGAGVMRFQGTETSRTAGKNLIYYLFVREYEATEPTVSCAGNTCEIDPGTNSYTNFQVKLTASGLSGDYSIEDTNTLPSVRTWSVNIKDLYNDSDLAGVTVTFSPGCTNTTDATGFSHVTNETSGCIGLSGTLSAVNLSKSTYASNETSYIITENSSTEAGMYQGLLNITSITRLIDDTTLGPALGTWTVNTSGGKTYNECAATYPCYIYLQDGTNTLTLQYSGAADYYNKDFQVNITAPEAKTTTVTGVYDALIHVNATNAFTGIGINNFTLNVSNTTHAYAENYSTTSGSIDVPGVQGIPLLLFIDAVGYAYANTTITPSNTTPYYQFGLYTSNSIDINIYNEDTGYLITENITVVITGNSSEDTYTTTSGNLYIDLLTDGEYTIKLSGGNYSLRTYAVTVADRSTQTLNAYLSAYTKTVTFEYIDGDTGGSLETVTTTMSRLINSSWTTVATKESDITGRSQFTYTPNVKYCFSSTHTLYTTREYCFDPVIFTEYTVRLYKTATLDEDQDYTGVSVTWSPTEFAVNTTPTFDLIFGSPKGLLSTYNYTLSWPDNSSTDAGTNSYGEEFTVPMNISIPSGFAYVNLTIQYQTIIGDQRNFTYHYLLQDSYASTSFKANNDNTYGLGLITRTLITVLVVITLGGIATLIAGPLGGGAVGLLIMGYLIYIGFMPWWAGAISLAVGTILLMTRSS